MTDWKPWTGTSTHHRVPPRWTPRHAIREALVSMAELGTSPRRVNRSWNLALLTTAEPGRRNRRPLDAAFLVVATVGTGLAATVARLAPDVDADTAQALATVFGWGPNVWRAAFVLTLALALLITRPLMFRRRWILVRDIVVGLAVVLVIGALLGRIVDREWIVAEPHVFSNWGFPEFRLACAVAIFAISGPELVRPVRMISTVLVGAAALGAAVLGMGLPSEVLGAFALGL